MPAPSHTVADRNSPNSAVRVSMELERRRRRQRRKEPKETAGAEDGSSSIHDVPDDLLRRFFLRLDSPIWLIRAACACKRWRRAITDGGDEGRAFLRLASSLHPPTVVGQYHNHASGDLRFVPSLSTPAPIDVSRFPVDGLLVKNSCWQSIDGLLVKNTRWHVADCHGGLVLLHKLSGCEPSLPNFVVYDPLTRQHQKIYRPPPPHKQVHGPRIRDAFLLDGNDGNISVSNFRVLYRWLKLNNVAADAADPDEVCVFSTANGGDWRFLRHHQSAHEDLYPRCSGYVAGRVDGSLYLGLSTGGIIALDNTTLVFSKVDLPICLDDTLEGLSTFTVVHGAGLCPTSPPRTSIVHVRGKELEVFRQVHGSGEWVLEYSIADLLEATRGLSVRLKKCMEVEWSTVVAGTSFAILSAYSRSGNHNGDYDKSWFFSIDINTMQLRLLPKQPYRRNTSSIFNYTLPWPQFLKACP